MSSSSLPGKIVNGIGNLFGGGSESAPATPPPPPDPAQATQTGLNSELLNELNLRRSMAQFTDPSGNSLGVNTSNPGQTSLQTASQALQIPQSAPTQAPTDPSLPSFQANAAANANNPEYSLSMDPSYQAWAAQQAQNQNQQRIGARNR